MVRFVWYIFSGLLQKRNCVVLMVFQMATISICLNNNVHFDNVITVVSPGLLYCEGPPFSFSIDNCLSIPFLFKLSVYSFAYICIGSWFLFYQMGYNLLLLLFNFMLKSYPFWPLGAHSISLLCPLTDLPHSLNTLGFWHKMCVPGSTFTFLVLALESTSSPRSPHSSW